MPDSPQRPSLHLDADTSSKALYQALIARGYGITRTPNAWMPLDADDESQLLEATAHGRILLTDNIRDFTELDQPYTAHAGIVLAAQRRWRLPALITALERLMLETTPDVLIGQVRWLSQ